jgi:hypothetical protein
MKENSQIDLENDVFYKLRIFEKHYFYNEQKEICLVIKLKNCSQFILKKCIAMIKCKHSSNEVLYHLTESYDPEEIFTLKFIIDPLGYDIVVTYGLKLISCSTPSVDLSKEYTGKALLK